MKPTFPSWHGTPWEGILCSRERNGHSGGSLGHRRESTDIPNGERPEFRIKLSPGIRSAISYSRFTGMVP